MTPRTRFLLAAAVAALFPAIASAALDVAGIDKSIDPCTDFYGFANRTWMQSTPLPGDRSRWSTFHIIDARNEKLLEEAFADALAKPLPPRGSAQRKVIQFYASGMDKEAIEKAGLQPLKPYLARAAAVRTPADIARALGEFHRQGLGGGVELSSRPDKKDSTRYLAELEQAGLGMPDRDYYTLEDERTAKLREGYKRHVVRILQAAGDTPEQAAKNAALVFALETELARASMTRVERRDEEKTYNRMTVDALAARAPGFPWRTYFDAVGAKGMAELSVAQPEFMKAFAALAAGRPAEQWRQYLRWHVLHAAASKLPAAFADAHFEYFQRDFQGVKARPPRHREVLGVISGPYGADGLGMAVGQIFVARAFSPEAKARAQELVDNVKLALEARLRTVDWMTEETRARSLEKLRGMVVKIGYPEPWRDFADADVGAHAFVENWMRASAFEMRRQLRRLGKPVDRREWFMSPHIVNAYYSAPGNEIVFPAAILQPPFFDARADDAFNYGGIGMVIGHEITHGFDDRGRRYDKDGNLRDWWTPEDERRYTERAQRIVAQYEAMDGVEGVKPNGKLTLGENISDIGGMKIAFDALQIALKKRPQGPIDGLTQEQRFFIAFAQDWRALATPQSERDALLTGQHSLPRFRVRGPLAHMPEFARAFSCEPSKVLVGDIDAAKIW